ncbi:MAG: hypothetical protein DSZ28_09650 [Thiothrix sp.]|nr:MAG: hypothetical protein DSZ28_09650 [Thiothrix sp.]
MKVKKVAVTAAVCAALMGSQASFAEEQPLAAEGMDFAFDDAQVSSVQVSELSGLEMDETKGANGCQDLQDMGFFIGCFDVDDYLQAVTYLPL